MSALLGTISILWFLVSFVIVIYFAVKKKPWKVWLLSLTSAFLLFCYAVSLPSTPSKTSTTPTTSKTSTSTTPTTKVFDWVSADITVDTVKDALSGKSPVNPVPSDDFNKNISDIQVSNNVKEGQKSISVYYKAGTAWDDTDSVKRAGGTAIIIYSILFQNPKVEQVSVFAQTDMTDQYGKTATETGVKIALDRETANKIDWKGFSERHITDPGNIYRVSGDYRIHPGILKNVKLNEVKLR